ANFFPSTMVPQINSAAFTVSTSMDNGSGMILLRRSPIPVAPPMMIPCGTINAATAKAIRAFPPTTPITVPASFLFFVPISITSLSFLGDSLHGKLDPLLLQIHAQHLHIHHIAHMHHFQRMSDKFLLADLGNVDQSVLVHADINKHAKINDIPDRAL